MHCHKLPESDHYDLLLVVNSTQLHVTETGLRMNNTHLVVKPLIILHAFDIATLHAV